MSDDLKKALGDASTTFHKIAMAMNARTLLAKGVQNDIIRKKLEENALTDDQITTICAEGFEAAVMALAAAGDKSVTIFECGKGDVPP